MASVRPQAVVTPEERELLERWVRSGSTPQRAARRARIVLLAADGLSKGAIARRLSINVRTVALWLARHRDLGAAALQRDAPGRGRRSRNREEIAGRIRHLLATPREDGRPWTIRR